MDPRVQQVLGQGHLGGGEDLVGAVGVPGLPVENVIAAAQVIADDRGTGVQRVPGVDHGRQRLVVDVDQLQGVPGRVPVVGHHERDLLALEPHLVGGQHGLGVPGQGRHPGQPAGRQHGPGDDRPDLGVGLGRGGVHGPDAGVRVRAAQHRAVQHAAELQVVDEAALAPDEPGVLLAPHRAEAHWNGFLGFLGGGHEAAPCGCSAAQRTDRTMFS